MSISPERSFRSAPLARDIQLKTISVKSREFKTTKIEVGKDLFLRFPVGVGVGSLDSRFNYHSPSLYLEVETFRVGRLGHARLF